MIKTLPRTLTIPFIFSTLLLICSSVIFQSCTTRGNQPPLPQDSVPLQSIVDSLPLPFETKSVKNYSKVIGWPEGKSPIAPAGFTVTKFADGLQNPRWIYVTPNGDILVAEANTQTKGLKKVTEKISGKAESQNTGESANRITLLRDKDNDGKPELKQVLLFGLNQPLGMLVLGNSLYVANTDGLIQYPYQPGQTQIKSEGKKNLGPSCGGI